MDRAQAHTLEAIAASVLLVTSLLFALQVTAVTPLTGSTSSQHIENQQEALAEGVLAVEAANESLKATLLYWNDTSQTWHGAPRGSYPLGGPPTALGGVLNATFIEQGIAFNVNAYYVRDGERRRVQIVYLGEPSDHASVATTLVTLYDDDELLDASGAPTGTTLAETDGFYATDVSETNVYNVVQLEVVAWRM
jgi:hypothetical protein